MYDTILVPTDGSDHAVRAAEYAAALGRLFDATVHVLYAVDEDAAGGVFNVGGLEEEFVERLEAAGEEAIEATEAALDGDAVRTALRTGEPSGTILDYAEEVDADLLVMGTHGRTGVDHFVTGSVTERVLRRADAPVLTVTANDRSHPDGFERILLPTDGSDPAAAAVDHAAAVAERTDATVHVLYVVDARSFSGDPDFGLPADLNERFVAMGDRATGEVADRLRARGVDVVTEVRTGVPSADILAYADEEEVDLVAMGTAGRTGVGRYLLGSTTERVVRHANAPVLAVNARDEAD